jgi:NADP-dependent 3-hydroxy acid dehydrogenase YdfG
MCASFRVAVITGASSGPGTSLAKSYAAKKVRLGLLGHDRRRLAATAPACEAKGAAASVAAIDVAGARAMARWRCEFDREQPLDLLIANGGSSAGPHPDCPFEVVDLFATQVGVNLLGAINTIEPLLSAFCLPFVREDAAGSRSWPRSLLIGGSPNSPGCCASKTGLRIPRRNGRAYPMAST